MFKMEMTSIKTSKIHTAERNYGLDLCRILAMVGIIILHILKQGGVLKHTDINTPQFWLMWILEIIAYGSVNVFGMLSGYLGIDKRSYSSFRLLELLFTVFLYSAIITIIFVVFDISVFSNTKSIFISIFPLFKGTYWYITSYTFVFLMIPYINSLINQLSIEKMKVLCGTLFIFLSVIPSLFDVDVFKENKGYSALWLTALYIFGACYKRLDKKIFNKAEWILIALCNIIILVIKIIATFGFHKDDSEYMISYISPLVLIASLFFLQSLSKVKIKKGFGKVLKYCSLAAFDVYILHCHMLIFDNVIKNAFTWICNTPIYLMVFAVIGCAAGIYAIGVVTYSVRTFIYKIFKIDALLKFIAKPVDKIFMLNNEKETD